MEEENKLTLRPKDYIVFNGGLKLENITEDMVIEVELPKEYTVRPLKITGSALVSEDRLA